MSDFADTSVLVRYLTDDPPELAAQAETLLDHAEEVIVTEVALVETAHVLRKLYGLSRAEVVQVLIELLQKQNLKVHHHDKTTVIAALLLCLPSGRVSIPDALIWAAAHEASPSTVYSFDRRFPSDGIEVRQPG